MKINGIIELFLNLTLSFGIHVQNMQVCYIGTHVSWWFAASIIRLSTLGISPNAIPPQTPIPCYPSPNLPFPYRPQYVMFPSLCPCVLIVHHPPMSENMRCFIFCSCVSLLRMMFSRFIHVPTNNTNSSFLIAA